VEREPHAKGQPPGSHLEDSCKQKGAELPTSARRVSSAKTTATEERRAA